MSRWTACAGEISAENAIQTELNGQRNRYWSQDLFVFIRRDIPMKRIIVVVLLVAIAGIAGIVRSRATTTRGLRNWSQVIDSDKSSGAAREEIRKSYELSPGARVEVAGINGGVKIETSDSKTAEVYIERTGASQEILNRRKITIDSTPSGLTIRG